jgi:hypothetical protein
MLKRNAEPRKICCVWMEINGHQISNLGVRGSNPFRRAHHPFVTTREFLPPRFLLPDASAAEASWKHECRSQRKIFRANA